MSRKRKLLILAGILLVALVAAAPFLRPREDASNAPETTHAASPKLHLAASQNDEDFDLSMIAEPAEDSRVMAASQNAAVIRDEQGPAKASDESQQLLSPPELPDDFSTSLADDDVAFASLAASRSEVREEDPALKPASVVSEPPFEEPPRSALRRHTVRDGDTLGSLAARLLGDAMYAEEIYRLNREQLPRRDLLPIGAELLIPDVKSVDE